MESKTKGSFDGWNEVWTKELINPNYTESSPENIYQFWQWCYAQDLLNLIKGKNYSRFCELGAGRGTTSMYLSKNDYHDITMVDLAPEGFKVAEKSFEKYNLQKPTFLLSNVENTGLQESSFDCIYNIGLLEHFDDPKPTLVEAYRLLKQGGIIYMPIVPTMPYYKSIVMRLIFNPISLVKKLAKMMLYRNEDQSNINRTSYDNNYYSHLCQSIGYKNIECIPYNPYYKVNDDGKLEDRITFPMYKWYYNTFKKGKSLSLKTSDLFCATYLLVASK